MGNIGAKSTIHTPRVECLQCKYWKNTDKVGFFGFTTLGHCKLGYCKKQKHQKKERRTH